MSKWVQGSVVGHARWTDSLHSLQVAAPEVTFVAGQFGRLALPAPPGSKEEMLGRPYSFVNAPGTAPHEFYFVTVPDGPLTTRLAALSPGDPVWLLRTANGFFSVGELPMPRHFGACRPEPVSAPSCRSCARRSPGRGSAGSCWCTPFDGERAHLS